MLFSSITFLFLFLPIMLAVYYIAPYQWKNLLLLAGSLIFYAWGEPGLYHSDDTQYFVKLFLWNGY